MKRVSGIVVLFIICSQAHAGVLYVPSPEYSTIQSAINGAGNSDVIIVGPGTYYENINFLGKAITITSTNAYDPNVVATTIIDGSQPTDANNASVVTFNSSEGNDCVLTGFTITGGTGTWLAVSWNPTGLHWNRCGGGVVCYNMSSPTISRNIFVANSAGQGGAIYCYGDPVNPDDPSDPPLHTNPVITENSFIDNSAIVEHGFAPPNDDWPANDHGDGGAIVGFQGCDAVITGNRVENNHADLYGGGIHLRQWSNGLVENNEIIANSSKLGAGIHITYTSNPTVRLNLVQSNTAGNLGGGGIYIIASHPLVERNTIIQNTSANGAGIAVKYSSTGIIRSNLISDNIDGAGIDITGSSPVICHNTITHHSPTFRPGAIYCIGDSSPVIENNVIASNSKGYGIYLETTGEATIRYNDVWNNELGNYGPNVPDMTGIAGNICADPRLMAEPNLMVHLDYASPCIGAGDPNFSPVPDEMDFDGQPRVLNVRTDIGADEALPVWNSTKLQQYGTLQSAIDDSGTGEVIVATRGIYFENIFINDKSIQLRSLDANDWQSTAETIIDGNNLDAPVVTFAGAEGADCILAGLTITGAAHSGLGGGILGNGTAATLRFCDITGNSAIQGGGVYDFDGPIENCKITDNISSAAGGGLYASDGVYNCLITGNQAGTAGGGLFGCNGIIVNNTVVGNSAQLSGGGLELCLGTIANTIVWANTAPDGAGLKNCSVPDYSCLQSAAGGQGNIYVDPQFVEPATGDYHLTIYSDCIDAGSNNAVPQESTMDIDMEPRIFIFDPNETPVVDIGADEVIASRADFDGNGTVDYWDFLVMTEQWLADGPALQPDLTSDELVNLDDYTYFAYDWAWQAPWYRPGRESALLFDKNSGGYVQVETPEGCELNSVFTFTYAAWIYPLSLSQSSARIIGKNERAFMTSRGGVLFGYSTGGGTASSVSDVGSLQIGKWQFVMMTYDYQPGEDSLIYLYVDGKEVGYQIQSVGPDTQPPFPDWRVEDEWNLMIGSQAWSPGTYIPDAVIDEVAIYDRVLTQDEIDYLYNYGLGRPTPLSLNPIGLWHFDEGQDTIVYDSSGNDNHGALQGASMPAWVDGKFLTY